MSLKDLNFQSLYRKKDDVLNNFYIPALKEARVYKRVSAYFSSDVLKLYSKGLKSFIENGEKIYFIFSHHISQEDFYEIKKGYDGRYDEEILNEIQGLSESVSISNLAYLIAKGIVEIKIGFVTPGTLHFKFGLLEDGEDTVCFRGSTNETPAGLLLNGENFEVSCSWLSSSHELETIDGYKNDFQELWNNHYEGVFTVSAPQCVLNYLNKFSRNNIILDYEDESTNSFILDLDENLNLVGYSFLNDKDLLSENTLFYKTKLKFAISDVENLNTYFFKQLTLSDVKKVINNLTIFSNSNDFLVKLTNRLKSYLENIDLSLNKRFSLGVAIKEKDSYIIDKFNKFKEIVNDELERKLVEPQMWDAFHAINMIAACNFSVPGTGKTTIAYGAFGFLSSDYNHNKIKRIIMIGPKNSFMAWKNEFAYCFGNKRELRLINIQDPQYKNINQRIAELLKNYDSSNLILINYDMLQNYQLLETLKMLMKKDNYSSYLILDEAHKIKGFDSKRANAVISIAPYSKHKLILTGTPIPNSYLDIYNMLHILYNDDYEDVFGYTPQYLEQASYIPSRQEEINKKIYPFFCRTTKSQLKIPMSTEDFETGLVQMNEREKHLFELVYKYFGHHYLLLYIKLLQASINPVKVIEKFRNDDFLDMFAGLDDGDIDPFKQDNDDNDLRFLKDVLGDEENKNVIEFDQQDLEFFQNFGFTNKFYKGIEIVESLVKEGKQVVVWGVFVKTLYSIKNELVIRGIKAEVICGDIPLGEREINIQKFINGEFDVLISNPHTLAESVSLHKTCHDAVYFEYTFNLTHLLQSKDRIHRLGLSNDTITTYYYLILDGGDFEYASIDSKTLERLHIKEERMIKAVESENLLIKGENYKEDIDYIFKNL